MRGSARESKSNQNPFSYKDVVVIGNGPGGLSASYILSGQDAIYNGASHPDPMLSARLASFSPGESILHTHKLQFLAQGMEELGGTSLIGTLFDSLMHPGALMALKRDSPISWHSSNKSINHIVLGNGPPGGIWQRLDPQLLTLSLNSWMELPGLRISFDSERRASVREVAHYYLEYARQLGLEKYLEECEVTSLRSLDKSSSGRARWEIETIDRNGNKTIYRSKYCILATGSSIPKRLNVDGENASNVVHDFLSLDSKLLPNLAHSYRVLIIGAGLSAADAVILARFRNSQVIHSFRTEDVTLAHFLPESLYPEYHKVREMMRCESGYPGYTALGGTTVKSLSAGRATLLSANGKTLFVEFDVAAVMIGSSADLTFLQGTNNGLQLTSNPELGEINPKLNRVNVNPWTYETELEGLYAVGSLVGDMYVRYIPGGAIAASTHILHQDQSFDS